MYVKKSKMWRRIPLNLFLAFIAISILIPFTYIILISFGKDVFSTEFLPKEYTFQNYVDLFTNYQYKDWLFNSIYLALATMVASVLLTSISVYVFSRFRFKGRKTLFSSIMLVQIFPLMLSMVSIHMIFDLFGMLNKIESLIITDTVMASAYLVLLAKGYFDTIPFELDDAAQIDGAGRFMIYRLIILPLAKPILAIVAVQSFVVAYNEYVIANVIMTGGYQSIPISVGLQSLLEYDQYAKNWAVYCAGAVIASIPMLILFYSMQKYMIAGLSDGAVKQ